jgi:hypothetical protein
VVAGGHAPQFFFFFFFFSSFFPSSFRRGVVDDVSLETMLRRQGPRRGQGRGDAHDREAGDTLAGGREKRERKRERDGDDGEQGKRHLRLAKAARPLAKCYQDGGQKWTLTQSGCTGRGDGVHLKSRVLAARGRPAPFCARPTPHCHVSGTPFANPRLPLSAKRCYAG